MSVHNALIVAQHHLITSSPLRVTLVLGCGIDSTSMISLVDAGRSKEQAIHILYLEKFLYYIVRLMLKYQGLLSVRAPVKQYGSCIVLASVGESQDIVGGSTVFVCVLMTTKNQRKSTLRRHLEDVNQVVD
jgi:hypothetical protein